MDGSVVESHYYWADECVVRIIWDQSDSLAMGGYENFVVLAVALEIVVPDECVAEWEIFAPGQYMVNHMNHECGARYDMPEYYVCVIHDRREHYEDAARCEYVVHSNDLPHLAELRILVLFSIQYFVVSRVRMGDNFDWLTMIGRVAIMPRSKVKSVAVIDSVVVVSYQTCSLMQRAL